MLQLNVHGLFFFLFISLIRDRPQYLFIQSDNQSNVDGMLDTCSSLACLFFSCFNLCVVCTVPCSRPFFNWHTVIGVWAQSSMSPHCEGATLYNMY